MSKAVMAGPIPPDGLASKLHEIEATRTTGALTFRGASGEGEVRLIRGQLAMDQPPLEDGTDAVELLLSQTEGTFEVLQRLPPLPVSAGDEEKRGGSLQVHVAADLMNYCERAGLTGWLVLLHEDGDRAEIGYQRGELSGIRLQGPTELHEVFGWEEGRFEVEATPLETPFPEVESLDDEEEEQEEEEERLDPTLPRAPRRKKRRDDTAQHFLRVVEMTLAQVMKDRETHRPASRTGPPLPPMPATRESVPAPAAPSEPPKKKSEPPKKREPTIPIVYIDADAESHAGPGLRHAKRGDMTAEVVLPEAAPERRSDAGPAGKKRKGAKKMSDAAKSEASEATEPEKKGAKGGDDEAKELPTAVWAVIALVVVLLALITLSQLPAFD